ncbi:MAG: DUF3786 domain-containing protein [Clostridiales bacterium]|nr:DUF3786 domain-containing protein [Clostridiales bacterium]
MEQKTQGRKTSNYDTMRDRMELEFLKYDQEKMIEKYHLKSTPEYLFIVFIGREYRINRSTGRVEWYREAWKEYVHASYNESMTIFDVLCYSKPDCCLDGNFVSVYELKGVARTLAPAENHFSKDADFFADRCEELRKACVHLGGTIGKVGDVSAVIPLFDFLPVVVQFWDADDEFGAVLKFMWDRNTIDYMHFETTFLAVSHLIQRLKECIQD